jgi:hypothetical protein
MNHAHSLGPLVHRSRQRCNAHARIVEPELNSLRRGKFPRDRSKIDDSLKRKTVATQRLGAANFGWSIGIGLRAGWAMQNIGQDREQIAAAAAGPGAD